MSEKDENIDELDNEFDDKTKPKNEVESKFDNFDDFYHECITRKISKKSGNYSQFDNELDDEIDIDELKIPNKTMMIIIPASKIKKSVKCKNAAQAYKIFKDILGYEEYQFKNQEHLWIMAIDKTGYISCVYISAMGANNKSIVDPVDILTTSVLYRAKKIVLAHNHPNAYDKILLSPDDFEFTETMYYASRTLGVEVIDHIIIGDKVYYSFLENGYIELIKMRRYKKPYAEIEQELIEEKKKYGKKKLQQGIIEGNIKGLEQGKIEIAKSMLKLTHQ